MRRLATALSWRLGVPDPQREVDAEAPQVSIEFRDAHTRDAVRTIARVAGMNVIFDRDLPGMDKSIQLRIRNVRWDDALNVVLLSTGLVAFAEPGDIVRISTRDDPLWAALTRVSTGRPESELRPASAVLFQTARLEAIGLLLMEAERAESTEERLQALLEMAVHRAALRDLPHEELQARQEDLRSRILVQEEKLLADDIFVMQWLSGLVDSLSEGLELDAYRLELPVVEAEVAVALVKSLQAGVSSKVRELRAGLEELIARARIHLEFRELPLELRAILRGGREAPVALVMFDGRPYELDPVDWPFIEAKPDLVLQTIGENGVIFQFKGEKILKPVPRRRGVRRPR